MTVTLTFDLDLNLRRQLITRTELELQPVGGSGPEW